MSKKSKKDEIVKEQILNEEAVSEKEEAKDAAEPVSEEISERDTKFSAPKKSHKVAGLTAAKIILYALSFPVIIILSLIISLKIGEGVPFYSFWPYVGTIVVGLFGLIFLIVALVVTRKKSKKSIMQQTVALLICCVILTGGFALIMDTVLPDVIAYATSDTLYVEDLYNDYDEQAEYNKEMMRKFVRLNIMNGNYIDETEGDLSYATLAKKSSDKYVDTEIQTVYETYTSNANFYFDKPVLDAQIEKLSALDKELFDWLYENYVVMDYSYALKAKNQTLNAGTVLYDGTVLEKKTTMVNNVERRAFCLALTKRVGPTYAKLCAEGVKTSGLGAIATTGNEKMSWLFNYNYASINQDGYNPLNDDCGLGFATSNRMTVPVVIRLILNEHYTYTQPVYDDSNNVTGYEIGVLDKDGKETKRQGFLMYQYMPEVTAAYDAAGNTYVDGKSAEMFEYDDTLYYVYEDGHVEAPTAWCVLDMDGNNMAVTSIATEGLIGTLLGMLNSPSGFNELLNEDLTDVIATATNGQKLSLHLYVGDDSQLNIVLVPSNTERGYLGYQYMTWLQSNNLLITICDLFSVRNLLYIFGALSLVLIFAAGFCRELIAKEKAKSEEEKATAEAEIESAAPETDEAAPLAE